MSRASRIGFALLLVTVAVVAASSWVSAQEPMKPVNDVPNPYQTIENFFKLPEGRVWGSTSSVAIDKDGKSVWTMERCGVNSCVVDAATGKMSDLPIIMKFDEIGRASCRERVEM